jgi:hypothetical protein
MERYKSRWKLEIRRGFTTSFLPTYDKALSCVLLCVATNRTNISCRGQHHGSSSRTMSEQSARLSASRSSRRAQQVGCVFVVMTTMMRRSVRMAPNPDTCICIWSLVLTNPQMTRTTERRALQRKAYVCGRQKCYTVDMDQGARGDQRHGFNSKSSSGSSSSSSSSSSITSSSPEIHPTIVLFCGAKFSRHAHDDIALTHFNAGTQAQIPGSPIFVLQYSTTKRAMCTVGSCAQRNVHESWPRCGPGAYVM